MGGGGKEEEEEEEMDGFPFLANCEPNEDPLLTLPLNILGRSYFSGMILIHIDDGKGQNHNLMKTFCNVYN